jgi:hypothetical protein
MLPSFANPFLSQQATKTLDLIHVRNLIFKFMTEFGGNELLLLVI